MSEPDRGPLRVVQWATGNIGTRALRAVIEHPQLDLAGVRVYTPRRSDELPQVVASLG